MRALALALCVGLVATSGCAFAVKHPAITAGIVGATLGIATCEIGTDFGEHETCAKISGAIGLGLGGIVALAVLLGGEGNTVLQEPLTEDPPPLIRDKKKPMPAPAPDPAPAPAPVPDPVPAPTP